ncbi:hypothetical protein NP233_g10826 [Leucocoprinus birnbaumii]|uniref:Uncharacterized protein n=1 Tax=Leucocoprinus birnbaumii TaxID=56174 RepID=A0AAD5YRI2_9AGAR|nr:hypothetical protein NP233_g10826 [Leucocoprinus birnbaumii]
MSSEKVTLGTPPLSLRRWHFRSLPGTIVYVQVSIIKSSGEYRNRGEIPVTGCAYCVLSSGDARSTSGSADLAVSHQHCQSASKAFRVFYIFTMCAFCSMVSLRVGTMWDYHVDVAYISSSQNDKLKDKIKVAVATQIKPYYDPTFLGSNCSLRPFPTWFSAYFVAALIFNITALSLTAFHTIVKSADAEKDMRQEFRLLAFLIVCIAASAAILIIFALGPSQQISKQIASGFFILIHVSMGSRIFLTFSPVELNGPIIVSFGNSAVGPSRRIADSDPSWGSPSTINQSAIRSFPYSSTTKPSSRAGPTRPISLATSESHMVPLTASLSPPPPRHYPLDTPISMSGTSSLEGGDGKRETDAFLVPAAGPVTAAPAVTVLPAKPRAYRPLPVPPVASVQIPRNAVDSSEALTSTILSTKKRNKLTDVQSGWME